MFSWAVGLHPDGTAGASSIICNCVSERHRERGDQDGGREAGGSAGKAEDAGKTQPGSADFRLVDQGASGSPWGASWSTTFPREERSLGVEARYLLSRLLMGIVCGWTSEGMC